MARYGGITQFIIDSLDFDVPLTPLEGPYHFLKRQKEKEIARRSYVQTLWKMKRMGYIQIIQKNNDKFLKLTSKGQLEKLLQKAGVEKHKKWDGKWRVLIFDIPESSRGARDRFRWLLKKNQFIKLQDSVFASPYPLNREAIRYLAEVGLTDFIRIMKVEEIDNDSDLRKKFSL